MYATFSFVQSPNARRAGVKRRLEQEVELIFNNPYQLKDLTIRNNTT